VLSEAVEDQQGGVRMLAHRRLRPRQGLPVLPSFTACHNDQ
jgi:hypothetical protein